jgi:outer membrane protein OmpA-like peptidoglycan-associated protein
MPTPGLVLRVEFPSRAISLTDAARLDLRSLASMVEPHENLRVQLVAYAYGKNLSESKARRLSLSRALVVRSYLMDNGIKSGRIDVRALGDQTTEMPRDRVDVKVVER